MFSVDTKSKAGVFKLIWFTECFRKLPFRDGLVRMVRLNEEKKSCVLKNFSGDGVWVNVHAYR